MICLFILIKWFLLKFFMTKVFIKLQIQNAQILHNQNYSFRTQDFSMSLSFHDENNENKNLSVSNELKRFTSF